MREASVTTEASRTECTFSLPAEEPTEHVAVHRANRRNAARQSELRHVGDVGTDRPAIAAVVTDFPRAAADLETSAPRRETGVRRSAHRNELRSTLEARAVEDHQPLLVVVAVVAVVAVI